MFDHEIHRPDGAYLYFHHGTIANTIVLRQCDNFVAVDVEEDGRIIGIEILGDFKSYEDLVSAIKMNLQKALIETDKERKMLESLLGGVKIASKEKR